VSFTEESNLDSDNFTDAHLGGLGIGIVSSRGGSLEFLINDSEDVNEGVRIDTFAGSGTVQLKNCGENKTNFSNTHYNQSKISIPNIKSFGEISLKLLYGTEGQNFNRLG